MTSRHAALLRCALLALTAFFCAGTSHADEAAANGEAVERWFVQVRSLDALTEEGCYLIGAVGWDGSFYLMSQQANSAGDKLTGRRETTPPGQPVQSPDEALVWRFKRQGTGKLAVCTPDGSRAIYVPKDGETGIALKEDNATSWTASANGDGTFTLANAQAGNRFLALYALVGSASWGNYTENGADSNSLYIYKQATSSAEIPGEAALPDDGSRVMLYCNGKLGTTGHGNGLSATDATPYLLTDGTAAPGLQGIWTCRHTAGSGSFSLRDDNGLFLGHDLATGTAEALWRVENGKIAPAGAGDAVRILVYDTASGTFALTDEAEGGCSPAVFVAVGEQPDSALADGTKRLAGAWNAYRLAATDWRNVDCLDLRTISLPLAALEFANRPDDRHTFIYISETDAGSVPPTWDFVVSQKGDSRYLLTRTEIKEGWPLPVTEPFSYDASKLSYTRAMKADGGWETLCLPFDTEVPDGCTAATLADYADGELAFSYARELPAGTPAIVRPASPEGEVAETTFNSLAGEFSGQAPEAGVFRGTYVRYEVESGNAGLFLLNATGEAFVRAAAGSYLTPFRAAICLPGSRGNALKLPPTGIEGTQAEECESPQAACYTADGRRVASKLDAKRRSALPPGVYIVGGKKIIK